MRELCKIVIVAVAVCVAGCSHTPCASSGDEARGFVTEHVNLTNANHVTRFAAVFTPVTNLSEARRSALTEGVAPFLIMAVLVDAIGDNVTIETGIMSVVIANAEGNVVFRQEIDLDDLCPS